MRLLCLLFFVCVVRGMPRYQRETDMLSPLLSHSLPGLPQQALFIPNSMKTEDFDGTKPIEGAFFVPSQIPNQDEEVDTPDLSASSLPNTIPQQLFTGQERALSGQEPVASVPQPASSIPLLSAALAPQMMMAPLITTTPDPSLAPENTIQDSLKKDPELPPVDKHVDLDGDGGLSLEEVQYAGFVHHGLSGSVVEGMFKQVDENGDGLLNSLEFNNIRPLVLEKSENAALRYLQSVDLDKNERLSLAEAQAYLLRDHGIGSRDVERIWRLVTPDVNVQMDPALFSKLRRRIRGMTIRLARQIMKNADTNSDGHISLPEAQAIAFEQEGIGAGDVAQMMASVDDNMDGQLNAPEFADFERIVRARAVLTSKKALKVVDADGSDSLTMDEARRIAFEHYGFDEHVLGPFFAQADENEDGELTAVEFAGFRSVIRSRAVRDAVKVMKVADLDGDGFLSLAEAQEKTKTEDDMDEYETQALFHIADQNKSGKLDKVELADFLRLVRLSAIKFATDHFRDFDANGDNQVSLSELQPLIEQKYGIPMEETRQLFENIDVDRSGELIPAEIVDFRHEIRHYVMIHGVHTTPEPPHTTPPRPHTKKSMHFPTHRTRHQQVNSVTSSETSKSTEMADKTTVSTTRKPRVWHHRTEPTTVEREETTTQTPTTHRKTTHSTTTMASTTSSTTTVKSTIPSTTTSTTTEPPTTHSTTEKLTTTRSTTTSTTTETPEPETEPPTTEPSTTKEPETIAIQVATTEITTERTSTQASTTSSRSRTNTENPNYEYEEVIVEVDENGNEIERGNERDERKRLVDQQKKELNIPESTEVQYLDEGDPNNKSSSEYEIIEYIEEPESNKN